MEVRECPICRNTYPLTLQYWKPRTDRPGQFRGTCRKCQNKRSQERKRQSRGTRNTTPMARASMRYLLVADPDRENGLLVPGHILLMTSNEVNEMLAMACFTPGSVLQRGGKTYRVEWGQGKMQVLA